MDDMSASKIGVDEVHKIAILDIRIMNAGKSVDGKFHESYMSYEPLS
jgi:hypothetical protein